MEFIRESLVDLSGQLHGPARQGGCAAGTALLVRHAKPSEALGTLVTKLSIDAVFTNHDDEPLARDAAVQALLAGQGWRSTASGTTSFLNARRC